MYVLLKNQLICKKADGGALELCFALSEDLTAVDTQPVAIGDFAETDLYPVEAFQAGDCELLWIFDKTASDAATFKTNNLLAVRRDETGKLYPVWNMKETVGRADACVDVKPGDDNTFSFRIFSGKRFTVKVTGESVVLTESTVTK